MIRTGRDLYAARERLGWSTLKLGLALRLTGDPDHVKDAIREMERGRRKISGPISALVESFLIGYRPDGFDENALS